MAAIPTQQYQEDWTMYMLESNLPRVFFRKVVKVRRRATSDELSKQLKSRRWWKQLIGAGNTLMKMGYKFSDEASQSPVKEVPF